MYLKNKLKLKTKYLSIVIVIMYLVAMLRPAIYFAEYFANYDYIKEELCKNKDKPYLECNGSCYVESLLKSANLIDDGSSHKTVVPENSLFFPIFTLTEIQYEFPEITFSEKIINNYTTNPLIINQYINEIFRPPKNV